MYRNLDLVQEAVKRYGRCKDGVERIYIQESHGQAVASFLRIRDTKHAFEFVARPLHGKFNDYPRPVVKIIFATRYSSLEVHRSTDEILRNACEQCISRDSHRGKIPG